MPLGRTSITHQIQRLDRWTSVHCRGGYAQSVDTRDRALRPQRAYQSVRVGGSRQLRSKTCLCVLARRHLRALTDLNTKTLLYLRVDVDVDRGRHLDRYRETESHWRAETPGVDLAVNLDTNAVAGGKS